MKSDKENRATIPGDDPDFKQAACDWPRDEKGKLAAFQAKERDNGVGIVAGWKDKGNGFSEEQKKHGIKNKCDCKNKPKTGGKE